MTAVKWFAIGFFGGLGFQIAVRMVDGILGLIK